jgi:hypothetical protein
MDTRMSAPLRALARAAVARRKAETAYVAAVLAARAAGHTLADIGHAASVSRQAVWNLLHRHREG